MVPVFKRTFFVAVLLLLAGLLATSSFACTNQQKPASSLEKPVIGGKEVVRLVTPQGEMDIVAKVDTGADYSSIDGRLAASVGLEPTGKKMTVITEAGRQSRDTVALTFVLAGQEIRTRATLNDRSDLSTVMLIGKEDLQGFLVDASREFLTRPRVSGSVENNN